MLRITTCFLALGASTFAACGDDPVKNGELVVSWNHGVTSATCGTRLVTTVEARIMKGAEEIAAETGPCPTDAKAGTITISDVKPGSYAVEVEAFTAANKGTYIGTIAKQTIGEGKTVEVDVALGQKPASINIDWALPGGGRCSAAGIAEIEVFLFYEASTVGTPIGEPQKVECESTGIIFADLVPNPDVQLIAYAYDAADVKVARAQTPFFKLEAGDELSEVLEFEACPGTPPVCD